MSHPVEDIYQISTPVFIRNDSLHRIEWELLQKFEKHVYFMNL